VLEHQDNIVEGELHTEMHIADQTENGMYLVNVKIGEQTFSRQLIIQK
jgi:hypothetical protein